jgi:hypothetical protein
VELTVKITPRVAAQVARRLRLAASVRSRSMSVMVNDALDETLPSLDEIRMQLAVPAAGDGAGAPRIDAPSAALGGVDGPYEREMARRTWARSRGPAEDLLPLLRQAG